MDRTASSHQKSYKKIGSCIKDGWIHKTPAPTKFLIDRPVMGNEKISTKHQWEYQLGIDMLLYLAKHLHQNLTNMTKELLKANNGTKLQLIENINV